MLKTVDMMCVVCKKLGIARIDTTEDVVLMLCNCPEHMAKTQDKTKTEAAAAEGQLSLFG